MEFRRCLFFVLLVFTGSYSSPASIIEELKQKLKKQPDSLKFDTYGSLVTEYVIAADFKTAMLYAQESLRLAEKLNSKKGDGESSNLVGSVYFYQGKLPAAQQYYFRALKNFEAINYQYGLAQTYVNLGTIHGAQGEFEKSASFLNKAIKINQKSGNKHGLGYAYINLGMVYVELKDFQKAIEMQLKAVKIYEELKSTKELLDAYNILAHSYIRINEYNKALDLNRLIVEKADSSNNRMAKMFAHSEMADLYLKLNRFSEAIDEIKISIKMAEESGDYRNLSLFYINLHAIYEKSGDHKKALSAYISHIQFRDSVFNGENTKKLVAAQMQYDFDKKEAAAKSKQAIKEALARKEIQQQKIIILTVILGSALVVLMFLFFIHRRKTRHTLEVNKLENKTLRSQLNPHFIFNALASIQKYMNEHPALAENYLAKFGRLMREVLENSEKEIISLEEEFDMLKNYMDLEKLRVNKGFDYEINIGEGVDIEDINIPPMLLQPIVENAIWHGVAKGNEKGTIRLFSEMYDQGVRISIENNSENPGQNPKEDQTHSIKKKSFGLQIVKDRLRLLWKDKTENGSIESTTTDRGMVVTLFIPI